MTRDQLITLLKRYKENKSRLRLKLREKEKILRQLESIKETELKSGDNDINSSIRSKNSVSDKVGNFASNTIDKENDLKLELEALEKEIQELSSIVEEIDIRLDALKYKEREILILYYVEGCTYHEIEDKQKKSERQVRRIIQNATDKILKL